MTRKLTSATLGLLLLALPACGLTGDLTRPGPLIGNPSGEGDPASLPGSDGKALPPLPERRATDSEPEADDELLGGPGS